VARQGFGTEERNDVACAPAKRRCCAWKLLVGSEKSEVTVYGTTRVCVLTPDRPALDSATIDESRSSAGRSARCRCSIRHSVKQGRRLFVNATYFVTAPAAGARRRSLSTA